MASEAVREHLYLTFGSDSGSDFGAVKGDAVRARVAVGGAAPPAGGGGTPLQPEPPSSTYVCT